ncbi:uncharacterized protein LOC111333971 [Stylophora pistillata]|uniref:Kelch-like protein 6 n=1 Tax=Stylophora pistillata TaxID=50429 RepID=A0A2B4SYQ7_STYPI|nr:uncharacterized protein LOC111333971 [Stylophora pistillata]XP_022795385.1 uncharacterized protein LOC111333971 [Stylophora pistillata]PFX33698.1 Kelch-like protein 6 [Stylophora pistillata]
MEWPVNEVQQSIIADECEDEAINTGLEFVQEFTEEVKRNVEPIEVARNPFSHPWEEGNLVLVVNGVKLHLHRFMLTLSSPVFNTMLKSESKETSNAEITLPGKDADDILNLLKQLYPQERDEITMDNVERFLKLAEEYQIKTVLDLCATCLRNEPKTKDNAMKILLLVQKYRLSYVGDDCRNVLAKLSLQRLEKYKEFSDLNGENLRAILLPGMRRLEKTVKELSPQVSGMVAFAMWLSSQGRKDMMWCPVHIPNGKPRVSIRECLQTCPVCEKVIESLASNTIERQHRAGKGLLKSIASSFEYVYTDFKDDHFDSNFNSVVKNMFDLVD